jgi:hypothetical protein
MTWTMVRGKWVTRKARQQEFTVILSRALISPSDKLEDKFPFYIERNFPIPLFKHDYQITTPQQPSRRPLYP